MVGALLSLLVIGLVVALARTSRVRRYVVEGRSMLRAFAPGDPLVVEALSYRLRAPRLGEVVVLRWSHGLVRPPGSPVLDLKRLVAGPGATVTLRDEPYVLAANEWYVLGDNLDESEDSRALGPVHQHDIVGRVWFRY